MWTVNTKNKTRQGFNFIITVEYTDGTTTITENVNCDGAPTEEWFKTRLKQTIDRLQAQDDFEQLVTIKDNYDTTIGG